MNFDPQGRLLLETALLQFRLLLVLAPPGKSWGALFKPEAREFNHPVTRALALLFRRAFSCFGNIQPVVLLCAGGRKSVEKFSPAFAPPPSLFHSALPAEWRGREAFHG